MKPKIRFPFLRKTIESSMPNTEAKGKVMPIVIISAITF